MAEINLFNSMGRDAVVRMQSLSTALRVRWLDPAGRQASTARVIKSAIDDDLDALVEQQGDLRGVGAAIRDGDPEINAEVAGRLLQETSRVYVNRSRRIVHRVHEWEIIRNPDGTERERRRRVIPDANVGADLPALKWSGVLIPKKDAVCRFVFVQKMQLAHINGLTYDFLYGMAKELEEKDSLLLLGAGPKSNQPLVLRRNSTPYRGFLEGRTRGDTYRLVLHLSNLELKAPEASAPVPPAAEEKPAC
ncbi:MAG TPA: hypothetical protein VMP01_09630 [Pirellulaceae bacterium]|nr:hypothetical protein [Pirellulaceae bacterium]